jgi:hypothetical protein
VPGKNPHDDLAFALHDGGKKFFCAAHMAECAESVFEKILQFSQSCTLHGFRSNLSVE